MIVAVFASACGSADPQGDAGVVVDSAGGLSDAGDGGVVDGPMGDAEVFSCTVTGDYECCAFVPGTCSSGWECYWAWGNTPVASQASSYCSPAGSIPVGGDCTPTGGVTSFGTCVPGAICRYEITGRDDPYCRATCDPNDLTNHGCAPGTTCVMALYCPSFYPDTWPDGCATATSGDIGICLPPSVPI
jgi:hypothetical protein